MESENKNSIYKNAANYGLILGLAIVIYTLLLHFLGAGQNKVAGWGTFVFTAVAIYVGTKSYRDKMLEGYISYGRALGSGMLIVVFASLIQAVFNYSFFAYISPESMQEMFVAMEEAMLETGTPEDQIEMSVEMMKKFTTPLSIAISGIFTSAFVGLIISLVTAAFVKNEKNIFE